MIVKSLDGIDEERKKILLSATRRINDISNGLLQSSRSSDVELSSVKSELTMLSTMLDTIVSEKRTRHRDKKHLNIETSVGGYAQFASVNRIEIERVLSNLIENAIDAFVDGTGTVEVSLQSDESFHEFIIKDNGIGISEDHLLQIGKKGFSFGKSGRRESGAGIGLWHAKKVAIQSGGQLNIKSQVGKGTTVRLQLPAVRKPDWFVERFSIANIRRVVVVDDDISIHQIWQRKFADSSATVELIKISSLNEFEKWLALSKSESDLYLVDHEFTNSSRTGIDTVLMQNISSQTILVTSRFNENAIQTVANQNRIRILPKDYIAEVQIL